MLTETRKRATFAAGLLVAVTLGVIVTDNLPQPVTGVLGWRHYARVATRQDSDAVNLVVTYEGSTRVITVTYVINGAISPTTDTTQHTTVRTVPRGAMHEVSVNAYQAQSGKLNCYVEFRGHHYSPRTRDDAGSIRCYFPPRN